MKLIIDISNEVYEYWKEHKYEYVLAEAIANGKPYDEDNWRFYYDHGYKQAERDLKRPQGEWIQTKGKDGIEIYRKILCSHCNETSVEKYSFCPNCGAEMKGKEE